MYYVFEYNKENIMNEIESTKRKILKYVYSKSILHFDNYLLFLIMSTNNSIDGTIFLYLTYIVYIFVTFS